MNRSSMIILATVLALCIAGCSEKSNPDSEDRLFNAQREALDTAKEVEGVLQSANDERRKKIDN